MNKEILFDAEALSNVKGVNDIEVVIEAIKGALVKVTKNKLGDIDVEVVISRDHGAYEIYQKLKVVADEDFTDSQTEIAFSKARKHSSTVHVGGILKIILDDLDFNRSEVQSAKRHILEEIKKSIRKKSVEYYTEEIGNIVTGKVSRVTKNDVYVNFPNNATAVVNKFEDIIPKELCRVGERFRAYLTDINENAKNGGMLKVSRTCPEMLTSLFRLEIPEVADGVIKIMSVARDAGFRSKVAVKSNNKLIDPTGACIGMRGTRVQAITNELNNEKIDIVLWDKDEVQFIINTLATASISYILVNREKKNMIIAIKEDQLPQIIGRNGQNIRLASSLTSWELRVIGEKELESMLDNDFAQYKELLSNEFNVAQELIQIFIENNISSLEEIVFIDKTNIIEKYKLDKNIILELEDKVRDYLLEQKIKFRSIIKSNSDLIDMEEMTEDLALKFAEIGIFTQEALAEQSVIDLQDVEGLSERLAAKLIMLARRPWFADK